MIPSFEDALEEAVLNAHRASARADNKFDGQASAQAAMAWAQIAALLKKDDQ